VRYVGCSRGTNGLIVFLIRLATGYSRLASSYGTSRRETAVAWPEQSNIPYIDTQNTLIAGEKK